MQYRVCFLVLLITVLIGNLQAQHRATPFKINFNTDEHVLDKNDELVLNQLIAATQNAPYYEIAITAHTDSDADALYNVKLSERRAQSVKDYLLANKIKPKFMVSSSFGERKPEADNGSDDGKAINRRVDITLNTYAFHSTSDLIKQVSPEYKQTFTIDAGKQNTIKGSNGTSIVIPANALLTKSGKPVKGNVKVVLQEFLKPADAAFNQLSTVSNGRMLESGGMFSINAYADGEELRLKKGNNMSVNMPTINMKNEMSLFTAVTNKDGITEWKPTDIPFRPAGIDAPGSIAFVNLNTKYLQSLMIDCGAVPANAAYEYELPAALKRPANLPEKPEYLAPVYKKIFPWHQRLFSSTKTLQKKFIVITARREKAFERRLNNYYKVMEQLEPLWTQYRIDSARFEHEELDKFRGWLDEQALLHAANAEYKEQNQWNNALSQLISQSNSNAITRTDVKDLFVRSVGPFSQYFFDAYAHRNALKIIDHLKQKSMKALVDQYGKKYVSLHYAGYRNSHFMTTLARQTFAQEKLSETQPLMAMLDIAAADLVKKQSNARAFDESKVGNVYATSLSTFGTFNCDRFTQTPPDRMATITVPGTDEARVAFFVPSLNSYMYASRNEFGYYASLPKGTDVKVIYVSFNKDKGPVMQIERKRFTENTTLDLKPKSVTLKEMEKALAAI
ncbi:MAG: OmpA family protein [Bacteroidota bacterium]